VISRRKGSPRIAVFCSANLDIDPQFFVAASEFAGELARRRWELIYGGARVGLMGCFADEALKNGGVVRGAITESLAISQENPHLGIHELVTVTDLFERKRWMMDEADAFVIYPGGFGTLDEALEVISWKSLGCHEKPIVFVNMRGFWQNQLAAFDQMAATGMIRSGGLDLFKVCETNSETWKVLDGLEKSVF
jgi:uncharacterized protein (TIGR00730 family)